MAKQIVTVGDLVVDIVLDVRLPAQIDQHQMSPTLSFEPGGATSTIFSARNMGLEVITLGTVGDDFQGKMLKQIMDEAGVDTSPLVIPQNSTTTTVVALTDREQSGHVFLGHYGQGDVIDMTSYAKSFLLKADAVFMPGYTTVEERLQPLVNSVFDLIRKHQRRFYFDVGPFLGELSQAQVASILETVDVLLLTEDEVPFVTNGNLHIAELLTAYPDMIIVLKQGATGCQILTQSQTIVCKGFQVEVVDTIGAGDAFAGAFMWAHLNGYSLKECGLIANAMGAVTVQKMGAGRKVPTRAEVQAMLNNDGLIISF